MGKDNVSSRKLPATWQWKNVPGKVRISLQILLPEVHGRCKSVPGNYLQKGWRKVPGQVQINPLGNSRKIQERCE
jgi:hypothetical protein